MSAPKRIQLRRTKGWRKPEGALVVARPSAWGNPYRIGDPYLWLGGDLLAWPMPTSRTPGEYEFGIRVETCPDRAAAVAWFSAWFESMVSTGTDLTPLRGHDLACWCPLDQPCHADVLLELANGGAS